MRCSLSSRVWILFFNLFIFAPHCESRPPFACDPTNATTSGFPFCNVAWATRFRVRDLIGRLTLHEKILLLVNNAAAVDRLGIHGYEWWSEALHGVAFTGPGVKFAGKIKSATSFPQVITTAASFNASLWGAIGQVVSDEARAMYNEEQAGLTYWSPNVNVFRDPRWGRGQETPGEDPLVVAKYAVRYVKGLQGDSSDKLKVAACCKHFTAYDLDSWHRVNRYTFNAVVSKRDLEETYNVPFKACVTQGKVASVMCSYNQVNGKPTCADPALLRETIRGQWKLNGYIVSDCDSIDVFYRSQHYNATPEDAATQAIKAGLDLDCGPFLAIHTEKAIQSGKLKIADIDLALTNSITVQMRLGMFDGPINPPYCDLGPDDVCTPAHQQLALEAAQQGIVLLQNLKGTLPLSTKKHATVAVIGPNSNVTETMIGNYAGVPCGYTTPLQGISRYVKTIFDGGCRRVSCSETNHNRAVIAARRSDATVLVMGLDQGFEREGLDRDHLLLPGNQMELVSTVARASRGPVVLVLMSGGPIDVTFAKNDSNIAAILWVGYPGQEGGAAIADVLFGAVNPGGKLPMTWYPQDYLARVPMTDMRMRADPKTLYPGRTYKFYNGTTVFKFGFGLTYTNFRHRSASGPTKHSIQSSKAGKNVSLSSKAVRVSQTSCEGLAFGMEVEVENVGGMDGAHTVMVFATSPSGERKLVAFEKLHVAAGARKGVGVSIDPCEHMSIVDRFGIRRIEMGEHSFQFGDDLVHTVTLYNT